ncbi:MAG: redoxin domain-containing protein [Coraliomargarita sp.]|nr:redoxin domain-containing protein [Coraliomargarita sp.]
MKSTLLNVIVLAAVSTFAHAAVKTGATAPDFTATDTTGTSHSLSDFKGKYVVLEWTNHRCPFVKKFYSKGHMQALQAEMAQAGAVWLQIVSSGKGKQGYLTPEEGEALREKQKVASAATLLDVDGSVGKLYAAKTTPHVYLISPEGELIYQGAIDSVRSTKAADIDGAENYLKNAFMAATAGKTIEPATTKPYGCGVKY